MASIDLQLELQHDPDHQQPQQAPPQQQLRQSGQLQLSEPSSGSKIFHKQKIKVRTLLIIFKQQPKQAQTQKCLLLSYTRPKWYKILKIFLNIALITFLFV